MKISELQSRILATIDGLDSNEGDAKMAIATAREKLRGYKAVTESLRVQLDHAVRTDRLEKGSDVLPDLDFGRVDQPAVNAAAPVAESARGRRVG